jgi:hypothetical protein
VAEVRVYLLWTGRDVGLACSDECRGALRVLDLTQSLKSSATLALGPEGQALVRKLLEKLQALPGACSLIGADLHLRLVRRRNVRANLFRETRLRPEVVLPRAGDDAHGRRGETGKEEESGLPTAASSWRAPEQRKGRTHFSGLGIL